MGSNPTAGILFFILMFLMWCRLLCQAQRLYSSVVQRQSSKLKALGSIPSGGYYFVAGFVVCRLLVIQFCLWRGLLRSSALLNTGIWRNGSASDSRSEGWEFESLCPHFVAARVGIKSCATPVASSAYTRGGTRTHNLLLRGKAPYPLGHTGVYISSFAFVSNWLLGLVV